MGRPVHLYSAINKQTPQSLGGNINFVKESDHDKQTIIFGCKLPMPLQHVNCKQINIYNFMKKPKHSTKIEYNSR